MRAVDIIRAKRDGEALGRTAIDAFVAGVLDGTWADYQTSALLMAIVLRGMTAAGDGAALTDAMVRSGRRVDLSSLGRPTVGKHSTGGVGDKVSIVLAPARRGLRRGHAQDVGPRPRPHRRHPRQARVDSRLPRRASRPRSSWPCSARSGAPSSDRPPTSPPPTRRSTALRDVTATIESVPLISASVMSKKLAEGSQALVLDVKCGRGAFMKTLDDALALARSLVAIGTANGVRTEAFVTAMDATARPDRGQRPGDSRNASTVLDGAGPADLRMLVETLGGARRRSSPVARPAPTTPGRRSEACSTTAGRGRRCGRWWRRRAAIRR